MTSNLGVFLRSQTYILKIMFYFSNYHKQKQAKNQDGLAVLLVVVVIGAVSLILTRSASQVGLSGLETAWAGAKAGEVFTIGEACLEETLRRWQIDSNYTAANVVLTIGNGQCLITATAADNKRIVIVQAQSGDYYKKFKVEATINNNQIILNSWQEISE
jgi:hypothetical protein